MVFGKYILDGRIASGGMAEVYKARSRGQAGFEKIVVIKKILPHLAEEQEFVELFIDEARIAVQLVHVNIVQVFDLGEIEGQYFMAMEYIQGQDLSRIIMKTARTQTRFPIDLALFIIAEVLKALQFAHQRQDENGVSLNIVHCDISPQNILVSNAGEVKLTDFGISRAAFQMEEQHRVIRGKYAYMAPEQVEGRVLDARTDLFALMIVLYEMITGRRLFKHKDKNETLRRVRSARVEPPKTKRPEISEKLNAFILKGLKRHPHDRYGNATEMLEALSEVMSHDGYRYTNQDLSNYIRDLDSGASRTMLRNKPSSTIKPKTVVVLCIEAFQKSSTRSSPTRSLSELEGPWAEVVGKEGGNIWESRAGSLLCIWFVDDDIQGILLKAAHTAEEIAKISSTAGYKVAVGIVPGKGRVPTDGSIPEGDWQLAGPFYFARWLMNYSFKNGQMIMSEVAAEKLQGARGIYTSRYQPRMIGLIPVIKATYMKIFQMAFSANT